MSWYKSFWRRLNTPVAEAGRDSAEPRGKFTPRARQVLALARREAARLHHGFVGTEHVLLGLLALGQGTAVVVLSRLGPDLETVRLEIEKWVGTGTDQKVSGSIPYTPRVKRVLELAAKEAKALDHDYVGTEHILLGLLREGDGVAARVLLNFDLHMETTRQEVLKELDPNISPETNTSTPSESEPSGTAASPTSRTSAVDTGQRYDVYCSERNPGVVIYRNALFKGVKTLLKQDPFVAFTEFLELEQSDGQTIFISRSSVFKFCEHGVSPNPERGSGEKA